MSQKLKKYDAKIVKNILNKNSDLIIKIILIKYFKNYFYWYLTHRFYIKNKLKSLSFNKKYTKMLKSILT